MSSCRARAMSYLSDKSTQWMLENWMGWSRIEQNERKGEETEWSNWLARDFQFQSVLSCKSIPWGFSTSLLVTASREPFKSADIDSAFALCLKAGCYWHSRDIQWISVGTYELLNKKTYFPCEKLPPTFSQSPQMAQSAITKNIPGVFSKQ